VGAVEQAVAGRGCDGPGRDRVEPRGSEVTRSSRSAFFDRLATAVALALVVVACHIRLVRSGDRHPGRRLAHLPRPGRDDDTAEQGEGDDRPAEIGGGQEGSDRVVERRRPQYLIGGPEEQEADDEDQRRRPGRQVLVPAGDSQGQDPAGDRRQQLIDLGRMNGGRSAADAEDARAVITGEDHSPGQVGGDPGTTAIEEAADPQQDDPGDEGRDGRVGQAAEGRKRRQHARARKDAG